MTPETIAAAVVEKHFPLIRYAVCQNVSWSLLPYEADIIAITEAGTVHEIEIKVTKSDLKRDAKKRRWLTHAKLLPPLVDYYWLAVPQTLKDDAVKRAEEIGGGVISVHSNEYGEHFADEIRKPQRWLAKDAAPLLHYHAKSVAAVKEWRRSLQGKVWRLAAFRYWDIVFARNRNQEEKEGA